MFGLDILFTFYTIIVLITVSVFVTMFKSTDDELYKKRLIKMAMLTGVLYIGVFYLGFKINSVDELQHFDIHDDYRLGSIDHRNV